MSACCVKSSARILIFLGLLISLHSIGQNSHDFDADSVLYTPIRKPARQTLDPKKDTLTLKPVHYYLTLSSGGLSGEGVSFTASVIHGITLTPIFRAGLGLGFDSYLDLTAMPLFVNTTLDLSRNKSAMFLGLSGGVSKVWNYGYYYVGDGLTKFRGGYMINPEVGYRIRYHDLRIGISIGWKTQRVKYFYENYYNGYWDPVNGWVQGEPNRTTVKENKRRVAFNLSIGWR